jgi:hypothetical protein
MNIAWRDRPVEGRALHNPAFVALVLVSGARGFHSETQGGLPYPLAFLLVPIVVHGRSRDELPRTVRTSLAAWLADHVYLRETFPLRVRALAPAIREGVAMSLTAGCLEIGLGGVLIPTERAPATAGARQTSQTKAILDRAGFVGRWLGRAGSPATVFALWGVRP